MSPKYPTNTLEEHIALGNSLKQFQNLLERGYVIGRPKTGEKLRAARRTLKCLELLRVLLDDEVCALIPRERDPRNLATHVYYGRPLFPRTSQNTQDAFDAWDTDQFRG